MSNEIKPVIDEVLSTAELAVIEREEDIELNALADTRKGQVVHMVRLDEL